MHRVTVLLAASLLIPMSAALAGAPTAHAAFDPSGIDVWIDDANGIPIESRVFRAADGNTSRVLYALDGMRARNDLNGWEIETNVVPALTKANIK